SEDPWWQQSQLIGRFEALSEWMLQYLPEDLVDSLPDMKPQAAAALTAPLTVQPPLTDPPTNTMATE
ncbi:MAG: hypothetical protein KZQ58_01995, partial [gamma proteobacterium symbiont of Bathyaustriella thionipta]|nr:hypothetical protein [gamma proteobacterium symbiont of Bathyaustriella thionipta]